MARPILQITTLHNYKINDLIELKNTTTYKYTRLALTIVAMEYQGYSTIQIIEATGLSKSTVFLHIRKWNKVGMASTVEGRGGKGINIVGSTCILNDGHTVNDIYDAKKSITSQEIQSHLEHLIELNPNKKVVVFLDNASIHRSIKIQEFYRKNKDKLQAIPLSRYYPYMNPQENVWHYLKYKLFRPSSRGGVVELIQDTEKIFIELNPNKDKIHSLAYARSFLV